MDVTMNAQSLLDGAKAKMKKTVEHLDNELSTVRAGKANPKVLDSVSVDYYGTPTSLSQVASVTVPDARTILIQPWEKKMLPVIEKAILVANLGFTPSNNGDQIRINVPALTEERRKELVKQVRGEGEHAKVSLRTARRDAMEAIKKLVKDGLPEDVCKDFEDLTQKTTEKYNKQVEEVLELKEKEIMTV